MTHNYNLRYNPLVANNEENNVSDPQTFDLIINLEKKILPRFDALDKELLNLKGVHKRSPSWKPVLKVRMKVNNIENKVMSLEINGNHLKQCGRRNNLEITGTPYDVSDENLEEKVVQVLSEIQVNFSSSDIEAWYRIGKSKNSPRKKKQLYDLLLGNTKISRKGLININKSSRSLSSPDNNFIN